MCCSFGRAGKWSWFLNFLLRWLLLVYSSRSDIHASVSFTTTLLNSPLSSSSVCSIGFPSIRSPHQQIRTAAPPLPSTSSFLHTTALAGSRRVWSGRRESRCSRVAPGLRGRAWPFAAKHGVSHGPLGFSCSGFVELLGCVDRFTSSSNLGSFQP